MSICQKATQAKIRRGTAFIVSGNHTCQPLPHPVQLLLLFEQTGTQFRIFPAQLLQCRTGTVIRRRSNGCCRKTQQQQHSENNVSIGF